MFRVVAAVGDALSDADAIEVLQEWSPEEEEGEYQKKRTKNVLPVSTAEYNPCGWRAWLNGTTLTVGMQNVFDSDPPFVAGAIQHNYDESLATIKGRFWYVQLKKKF